MDNVYTLSLKAGRGWADIGQPWLCDFRADSHWKEVDQTNSQATQW